MRVIKPPQAYDHDATLSVFLAGSIEQDTATRWQDKLAHILRVVPDDLVLLNPRRDSWDSTWVQSAQNPNFHEQVTWELDHIENADLAVFYFDPKTKSPITLMELGYTVGRSDISSIVCCPEGFWRKGNVDILCERNDIPQVEDLYQLATYIIIQYQEAHGIYQRILKDYKNGN